MLADSALIPAQRRRAQNRASQRAFRERKERHVKNLEQQLDDLHRQYEELLLAYDRQKEDISNLRVELQQVHSEKRPTRVPQNSPLTFTSASQAQDFHSDNDSLPFPQDNHSLPQSQSLTPASSYDSQFPSRASTSEELTPFGSILPLTPSANYEHPLMFHAPDLFLASQDGTKCYSDSDCPEAVKFPRRKDVGDLGISEDLAVNSARDLFEDWR